MVSNLLLDAYEASPQILKSYNNYLTLLMQAQEKGDQSSKEIEIRVKKIIVHKKIHALLQEIKKDWESIKIEPSQIPE